MAGSTSNALSDSQIKANEHASNEQEQKRREDEYRRVKKELSANRPLSRRELSGITGIEIGNLCRCLNNLQYLQKSVTIAYTAKCKSTGKKVYHYTLASKLDKQEGAGNGQPQ